MRVLVLLLHRQHEVWHLVYSPGPVIVMRTMHLGKLQVKCKLVRAWHINMGLSFAMFQGHLALHTVSFPTSEEVFALPQIKGVV